MGRENMTLAEKIIYLADYIDETRTYEDCVALRNEFFSAEPEKMSKKEQIDHLGRVILHSFEITIADLTRRGKVVSSCTVKAKNSIISELKNS
jgi:nicotinate-nucleotide adenylyltransferase